MEVKTCSRCADTLPVSAFNRSARSSDQRQTWCRSCTSAYYYENRERLLVAMRPRNRERKDEMKALVRQYLETHPCVDCGETDPVVLEFDHVRGVKTASIAKMLQGWAVETLLREIAKCDVRCANCHRRKTTRERRWRSRIAPGEAHSSSPGSLAA